MTDSRLDEAFRALRAETAGRSKHADQTLVRVLASTRARAQKRRHAWRYFVPLAAVLVATSAWAGASGRLAAIFASASSKTDAPAHGGPVEPAGNALPIASTPAASAAPPPVELRVAPPVPRAAPSGPVAAASAPPLAPPAQAPASAVSSSPVENPLAEDKADFETAYRVHASGAPSSAVKAWDVYLAAHPKGRFVPEARYARAVALVHAGQTAAAREALRPFAEQAPGSYRRDDAARLLEGLGP